MLKLGIKTYTNNKKETRTAPVYAFTGKIMKTTRTPIGRNYKVVYDYIIQAENGSVIKASTLSLHKYNYKEVNRFIISPKTNDEPGYYLCTPLTETHKTFTSI